MTPQGVQYAAKLLGVSTSQLSAVDIETLYWQAVIGGQLSLPDADDVAVGAQTVQRALAMSSISMTSGTLRLSYFTAPRSEQWTQVRMGSTGTAAAATPTLIRFGLYIVDATSGDLALAASTPNDTALFAAINTSYSRSLTAPINAVAGQRYAFGSLVVSAAAVPSVSGSAPLLAATETAIAPRLCGFITSLTDLPASIAAGSIFPTGSRPYAVLLP